LRPLRLAERDPQEATLIVEIAADAVGDLARAKTQRQRGQNRDRADVSLVRELEPEIDELASLVDAELELAAVTLPDRLHALDRVVAQPLLLHAPRAERLRSRERVAMRIDLDRAAELRVQLRAAARAQIVEQPARLSERDPALADHLVELEEATQMEL